MVESISEVEMGLVVKGLVCKEEDFKQDALWDTCQWRFCMTGVM